MLRSLEDLERYRVVADGISIGHVTDLAFDDESWVVRSLMVETGAWLSGRTISVSTLAVEHPDWATKRLSIASTRVEIEDSSCIDFVGAASGARLSVEHAHFRSYRSIVGYRVHATDGEIGLLRGLLVDDETWGIQYIIVDTGDDRVGHPVLVSPQWIKAVAFSGSGIALALTQDTVRRASAYDPTAELTDQLEPGLYENYGHIGSW